MNTQQLQCFLRVADRLNFTKAAEELYLSTPTVTHHIKSLEEELGVTLFHRTSKMVRLTEAGLLFYGDAKEIMGKIDMSRQKIAKALSDNLSFLHIGCASHGEAARLQPVLTAMQEAYPNALPQIFTGDIFRLKTMFKNGHLDLLFVTREMTKDMDCIFKKIRDTKTYAVFPAGAAPEGRESISIQELGAWQLITLSPRFIPFQQGNTLQEKLVSHSREHFHIVCESSEAGILLVKAGYGAAILPGHEIPAHAEGIALLPLEEQETMEYGIACKREGREPYVKFFMECAAGVSGSVSAEKQEAKNEK